MTVATPFLYTLLTEAKRMTVATAFLAYRGQDKRPKNKGMTMATSFLA